MQIINLERERSPIGRGKRKSLSLCHEKGIIDMGYTDNDIKENAKRVHSLAGLLRALGLKPFTGTSSTKATTMNSMMPNATLWHGNKSVVYKKQIRGISIRCLKKCLSIITIPCCI